MSELERNEQVMHDAMCFVLGYISRDAGCGLDGLAYNIDCAIVSAMERMNLSDSNVARLKVLFNVA